MIVIDIPVVLASANRQEPGHVGAPSKPKIRLEIARSMSIKKHVFIALSAFMFAFFFAQAMSVSLLAIWLKNNLHLSGTQIGMVFSANFMASLCSQPLYGFISDKVGLNKTLMWCIATMVLCCGFFFTLIYKPLLLLNPLTGAIIGGIYIGVTFNAGAYAIEAYADRAGRKHGFEYARVRAYGSLGFAVAALFSGTLFNIDPRIDFFLATAAGLVMLPILMMTPLRACPDDATAAKSLRLRDALDVLNRKDFWRFMVLILGVTSLYWVYDLQFPAYFASQFATTQQGTAMFGYLNSAQIFVEAGMFYLAPVIVNRIGAKNGLLLAGAIMIARIAGSGLVTGPLLISCMKMMHALELPILFTAIFRYIAQNFESRLSSTIYLVGSGFIRNIGITVLSYAAGLGYDALGFPVTYLVIAALAAIFWLVSVFALSPSPANTNAPQVPA